MNHKTILLTMSLLSFLPALGIPGWSYTPRQESNLSIGDSKRAQRFNAQATIDRDFVMAVEDGNVRVAAELLVHGANPDALSFNGITAREIAMEYGSPEMVALFQELD